MSPAQIFGDLTLDIDLEASRINIFRAPIQMSLSHISGSQVFPPGPCPSHNRPALTEYSNISGARAVLTVTALARSSVGLALQSPMTSAPVSAATEADDSHTCPLTAC